MKAAARIAEDTWERVGLSWEHNVRLGEETLTDLLALDFVRFMSNRRTKLLQTTKLQESTQGTDLEIRIKVGHGRAILIAIQAKKLSSSGRYESLNAKVKSSNLPQIDVLENYSRKVRAIPLYLLYNYVDECSANAGWRCCQDPELKQLGCTLVPSWRIREAIRLRGHRNFSSIHGSNDVLPWRCLFECPKGAHDRFLDKVKDEFRASRDVPWKMDYGHEYEWLEDIGPVEGAWPEWLWTRSESILSLEDLRELRSNSFAGFEGWTKSDHIAEEDFGPRRLLLVDSVDEDNGPEIGEKASIP